MEELIVS